MHHSFYRRPLFITLAVYALGLAVFFAVRPPERAVPPAATGPAEITGTVTDFAKPCGPGYSFTFQPDGGKPPAGPINVTVLPQQTAAAQGCAPYAPCLAASVKRHSALNHGEAPPFKSRVAVAGELVEPWGDPQADGFSPKRYLAAKGIYYTLKASSITITAPPPALYRAVNAVRGKILAVFSEVFNPAQKAVISGITLGDRTGLTERLNALFRDSGAMHLLVASGSNVGFVTFGVYLLCALFMVRKQYAVIPAIICAGFYTLCAGADAPLLRALLMASAGAAGFLLGRESGVLNGLVVAALGILLADPRALLRADFIMSVLASAGIIMGMAAFPPAQNRRPLVRYGATVFFMSLFAQLLLLPVLAQYFQRVPVMAVISNLAMVPLAGALMCGGFLTAALALLPLKFPFFAAAAATAALADLMLKLAELFASLPGANVWVRSPGWGLAVFYYCAAFTLLNFRLVKAGVFPHKRMLGAGLAALLLWLAMPAKPGYSFARAQGGGVTVFRAANGVTALSGSGCDGVLAARAVLAEGRKRVNVFVAPSLAEHYIGGLTELDHITPVEHIVLPYGPINPKKQAALNKLAARGVKITRLWPGDTITLPTSAGPIRIAMEPGFDMSASGRFYTLPYYTGNTAPDAVSFRITADGAALTVGSRNRYAELHSRAQ